MKSKGALPKAPPASVYWHETPPHNKNIQSKPALLKGIFNERKEKNRDRR